MLEELFKTPKIEEKQMERDRYIQGQLDLLQTKLKRLEQVISVGMPLAEAEETIDRLDSMEREIKITASKTTIVASVIKELKTGMEEVRKGVDDKASMQQIGLIGKRVEFLEKLYGELSSSKTKDIFLNIVDIMQNIEARVKNLEEISHKNISLLFNEELDKVKSTVEVEQAGGSAEAPGVVGRQAGNAQAGAPKGLMGQLQDFLNNLFKRQ